MSGTVTFVCFQFVGSAVDQSRCLKQHLQFETGFNLWGHQFIVRLGKQAQLAEKSPSRVMESDSVRTPYAVKSWLEAMAIALWKCLGSSG